MRVLQIHVRLIFPSCLHTLLAACYASSLGAVQAGNASSNSSLREDKKDEENIPPFSSYSSGSLLPLPHPRKLLQDITHLIESATHHVRSSASVAEARAHARLGVRSSSKKCSKKKAAAHLVGVVSSEKSHQRLRKSFR